MSSALPTASMSQTRRAVAALLRSHRSLAALTAMVLLAGTVAGLAAPPLLGRIVDLVITGEPPASGPALRPPRPSSPRHLRLVADRSRAAMDVGEGGHQLTPTQAQQLALARLVLADPPLAILDEATAEAGSAGARTLEAAAARALEGRTAIIVAHRLTQAAAADRIMVLNSGQVVETGTHEELVAANGPYAALWSVWTDTRDSST